METLTGASLRQGSQTGRLTALTERNVHVAWESRFGPEEQLIGRDQLPEDLEVLVLDGGWQKLSEHLGMPEIEEKKEQSETAALIEELQQITEKLHSPFKYQACRGPGPNDPGKCRSTKNPECDGMMAKWRTKEDCGQKCYDCRRVSKYLQKCVRKKPRSECDSARVKWVKVDKCWKCGYNQKYKQDRGYGPADERRKKAKKGLTAARSAARKGAIASVGATEKRLDREATAKKQATKQKSAERRKATRAARSAALEKLAAAKERARRGSVASVG